MITAIWTILTFLLIPANDKIITAAEDLAFKTFKPITAIILLRAATPITAIALRVLLLALAI